MYLRKIVEVIRESTPQEKISKVSPEQIQKLKTISAVALAIVGVAGVVTLSAIAPNIFIAIERLFLEKSSSRKLSKREKDQKVAKTFYYLKRSGLIKMKPTGQDFLIFLTRFGKKRMEKLNIDTLIVPEPKFWDGKWWQVAADIPTKEYKKGADLLRKKLKEMRFFPLQRTLWFYPYNPRKEVGFIIRHYGIEQFVTVMEVSRLDKDDERKMKKFFKEKKIL